MTDYSKTTDFAAKDALPSGNANKLVKGTEIDNEFNAIASAIATKADTTAVPGGLNAPADPGDDGKYATASGGDLVYIDLPETRGAPQGPGFQTQYRNLLASRPSVSTLTYTADEIVVYNSSNEAVFLSSFNQTASLASSGANGLDTGSEAASTWYHVWAIWNGTLQRLLLSTSNSSPTLPSGYTHKGYLGAWFNDGSSNLLDLVQADDFLSYINTSDQVLSGGGATVYTSVAIEAPDTARKVRVNLSTFDDGSSTSASFTAAGSAGEFYNVHSTLDAGSIMFDQVITDHTQIYYRNNTTSDNASIFIYGWKF